MNFEVRVPKSSERSDVEFQETYRRILNTSVSPENIETFFETALNELVVLVQAAVLKYKQAHPDSSLERAALEDEAVQAVNLPGIQETLQAVADQVDRMTHLKRLVQSQTHVAGTVFVPPSVEESGIVPGSGVGLEQRKLMPRLLTLLYILENDLGYDLSPEDEEGSRSIVHITQGVTTDQMMRKSPYFRVLIDDLKRAVYVCEEEGNASYVFDTEAIVISIDQLDAMSKTSFNELIKAHPEVGARLIQSSAWREKMISYLTQNFDERLHGTSGSPERKSDFVRQHEIPERGEGWKSATVLPQSIVSSPRAIRNFVEQYRAEHPDWFEVQRPGGGRPAEHYHPELVKLIEKNFSALQQKEGWKSASLLQEEIHTAGKTIKAFVEQFRTEHPEWFEIQGKAKKTDYYHPDLVEIIKKRFQAVPFRKDGWESLRMLERGASREKTRAFAEQFRAEHPEWFEIQKPKRGAQSEHYHPDLVKKIKER